MTARVHSARHQQQSTSSSSGSSNNHVNANNPNNVQSKQSNSQQAAAAAVASASSAAAAAVVAAVARLHQQALQQQHLFVDEDDSTNPSPCTTPSPGPKLADGRRANKPLMEKRRRARINQSLAALKALILDSARLENTKHSKLEKADILELTVRHLQRQRSLAQPGLSRYKAGYQDCSREVSRYLDAPDIITGNTSPIDPAFKQRLLRHLDSCVSELDLDLGSRPDSGLGSSPGSVNDRVLGGAGSPVSALEQQHQQVAAAAAAAAAAHCNAAAVLGAASMIKQEMPELLDGAVLVRADSSTAPGDENNNSSRPTSAFGHLHPAVVAAATMPGMDQAAAAAAAAQANSNMLSVVQVIPSRLPDGQVVFLLPSHYVQLAAAAAANGINIGPNPPAAIWATTNMSLLKATDKLMKRPLMDNGDSSADWTSTCTTDQLKPAKSPRIEAPAAEQPLDFTTNSAKKLKAARYATTQHKYEEDKQLSSSSSSTSSTSERTITTPPPVSVTIPPVVASMDEKVKRETITTTSTTTEIITLDNVEQQAKQQQQDEEGMWRPW